MKPIDRPNRLVSQVIERLREMILDGTLPPGTELRQEKVSADLGVSRTPLREAFRVLERDGLVATVSGNRNVVVELSDHDMLELLQIREVLDGLAARLAAERELEPEAVAELTAAAAAVEESSSTTDLATFIRSHVRFHTAVFAAAGNSRIDTFLPMVRMTTQVWYSRLDSGDEHVETSAHEHQEIADAILAGDGESAERQARAHVRDGVRAWQARLAEARQH